MTDTAKPGDIHGHPIVECTDDLHKTLAGHRHDAEVAAKALRDAADEAEYERDIARHAHQSANANHFAHDYCRWVGHAEALTSAAARVIRGETS